MPTTLEGLRTLIDEIDDELQDLLIRRAEVVAEVNHVKRESHVSPVRPGREAQILRRLVASHHGPFPRRILLRIWREILSGTVAMQTDFVVAVQLVEDGSGLWDLARDHYGSHTPLLSYGVSSEVISAVIERRATVGILPLPQEGDRDLWWRYFSASDRAGPRVISRLPVAGWGNGRGNGGAALVIGMTEPEASGEDCGLLTLEANAEMSRGRLNAAFTTAGLAVTPLAVTPGDGWNAYLFEIDTLLALDDPRMISALATLGEAVQRVSLLGFYARPFTSAALGNGARE